MNSGNINSIDPKIKKILELARKRIVKLEGHTLDILQIMKPDTLEYARLLAKTISKLSPLIGNLIEYSITELLNKDDWGKIQGKWIRQDPGFPDTIFNWCEPVKPGIEVKTWFPLSTEITARFKDSIDHFAHDQTDIAIVAWIPEHLIYGKPKILSVFMDTARSCAAARDIHYHNPPDYLVFEPENTENRTINLQQTNTNGFKFQGTSEQLKDAEQFVAAWGLETNSYSSSAEYQTMIRSLLGRYTYRLDTNYAKIDRIRHEGIERFKTRVLGTNILGHTIRDWACRNILEDGDLTDLINHLNLSDPE